MATNEIIPEKIYHIFNRGVNRQPIFFKSENMNYFLTRVRKYFVQGDASLLCYYLMPNHFHLLVQPHQDNFGRKVMLPLMTSFSKSINLQENRVGPLFQGNFKLKGYPNDETVVGVSKYIHQNPVKAGIVNDPAEWVYSSYPYYKMGKAPSWLDIEFVLSFFSTPEDYQRYIRQED